MSRADPIDTEDWMERLGLSWNDIEESFIRGSGPGGQKINKTSSTVRLMHRPSGIEIKCQEERSQSMNRQRALVRLCEAIEERRRAAALAARQEREKERRRKRPKPAGVKRRMVESKRRRAQVKSRRGRPGEE